MHGAAWQQLVTIISQESTHTDTPGLLRKGPTLGQVPATAHCNPRCKSGIHGKSSGCSATTELGRLRLSRKDPRKSWPGINAPIEFCIPVSLVSLPSSFVVISCHRRWREAEGLKIGFKLNLRCYVDTINQDLGTAGSKEN